MKTPTSLAHPAGLLELRWLLTQLAQDERLAPDEAHTILRSHRTPAQKNWHPLQWIAFQAKATSLELEELTEWLSQKTHLPHYHIDPLKIDVPKVTQIISYEFAERHKILIVEVKAKSVVIATAEPFYREWEKGLLHAIEGKSYELVIANPEKIHRARIEFYNVANSVNRAAATQTQQTHAIHNFEQLLEINKVQSADANDQHVVNIVDWLLQYAFDQRASDIHLEPRRDAGNVRFRIDGILHQVYEMPAMVMSAIVSRLKIVGRMNVAEKRRPQDGRLKTKMHNSKEVELRLSTLPTAFGEKLVIRIFDPQVLMRSYQQLGFSAENQQIWHNLVQQSHGIVLVTGPTGSGKTSTLYTTLRQLARPEVNICTLEDPIEMVEPRFNQMQVQPQLQLGFAEGIRALLRQDPDIIMVGEIRDLETAEMAIQAALTGHLVISTLHTNDAPSAITRLAELGVPHYLISATLLGVMAQRLVRTLCTHCKQPHTIDARAWLELTTPWKQLPPPSTIYQAKGCLECRDTGYMGRLGVYEILSVNESLQQTISGQATLEMLRHQAQKQGMQPLRISGALKIAEGLTTLEEVFRVTPAYNAN